MKKQLDFTNLILIFVMFISLFISGGFFEYVSCGICLVFVCFFIVYALKENKWNIVLDINTLAIFVLVFSYAVVSLWSVDKGVALVGFFKFIPLLFVFIVIGFIDDKEKYITLLPTVGMLMSIYSFIMMRFNSLGHFVSVGDRMSGTFQYPNTFAIFLLVCVIIAIFGDSKEKFIQIPIILLGIYESGSLTVYILTAFAFLVLLIISKENRKFIGITIGIIIAIGILLILTGIVSLDFELKSSTFTGRLLYYKDALPVILSHPFGLGYYGYYFIQPSIQTGLYNVLNVHNELLQIMLDVGILPALLFYGVLIRQLFVKEQSKRNKVAILVILLHSMLDYDFQFIAIMILIVLFLNTSKPKEVKVSKLSKIVWLLILLVIGYGAIVFGLSNWYYMNGDYDKSYNICKSNTRAQIQIMYTSDDVQRCNDIAQNVIKKNDKVAVAYSVLADVSYIDGDVDSYIKYKTKAIELAPYNFYLHIEYLDTMYDACEKYISIGDYDSAEICLDRMKSVKSILNKTSEKTSDLAWKIQEKPILIIPAEYEILINELEMKLYER